MKCVLRITAFTCLFAIATSATAQDSIFVQRTQDPVLSKLQKQWSAADDEDEQDAIWEKVEDHLSGKFDKDMKRRQKELSQVEKRIKKLRSQLEKREEMRSEIIGLQAKQITMGWEGLGWATPASNPRDMVVAFPGQNVTNWRSTNVPSLPRAPNAPRALNPFGSVATTIAKGFSEDTEALVEEILEAAEKDNPSKLKTLASKLAEAAGDMGSVPANDAIWEVYVSAGDKIENQKFWRTLAEAAEEASEGVEDARTFGNILDTAARCYYLGGKAKVALDLQREAVSYSAEANNGTPDGEIAGFLQELKEELGEDEDDEEDEDENEWEEDDDDDDDDDDEGVR